MVIDCLIDFLGWLFNWFCRWSTGCV